MEPLMGLANPNSHSASHTSDKNQSTDSNTAGSNSIQIQFISCVLIILVLAFFCCKLGIFCTCTSFPTDSIADRKTRKNIKPCEGRQAGNGNGAIIDLGDSSTCGGETDNDDYDSDSDDYESGSDDDDEDCDGNDEHSSTKGPLGDSDKQCTINFIGYSAPDSASTSDSESDSEWESDDDEDEDDDDDDDDGTPDNACAEERTSASDLADETKSVSSSNTITSSLMRSAYNNLPRRIQARALADYNEEMERSRQEMEHTRQEMVLAFEVARKAVWENGRTSGWREAYSQGFESGLTQGHARGYQLAQRTIGLNQQEIYNHGFYDGEMVSYDNGNQRYYEGWHHGFEQGRESVHHESSEVPQESSDIVDEDAFEEGFILGYRACYYRDRDQENPDAPDNTVPEEEMQALITIWNDRHPEEAGATQVQSTRPADNVYEYHPDPSQQHPNTPVTLPDTRPHNGPIPVIELSTPLSPDTIRARPAIPRASVSGVPRNNEGRPGLPERQQRSQTYAEADNESMVVNVSVASSIHGGNGEPSMGRLVQEQIVDRREPDIYEARWIAHWNARLKEEDTNGQDQ